MYEPRWYTKPREAVQVCEGSASHVPTQPTNKELRISFVHEVNNIITQLLSMSHNQTTVFIKKFCVIIKSNKEYSTCSFAIVVPLLWWIEALSLVQSLNNLRYHPFRKVPMVSGWNNLTLEWKGILTILSPCYKISYSTMSIDAFRWIYGGSVLGKVTLILRWIPLRVILAGLSQLTKSKVKTE